MSAQPTTGLVLYADFPTYVLYRPDKVRPHLKTYDYDAIQDGILGVMELRDNELFDANEVHSVWPAKGCWQARPPNTTWKMVQSERSVVFSHRGVSDLFVAALGRWQFLPSIFPRAFFVC